MYFVLFFIIVLSKGTSRKSLVFPPLKENQDSNVNLIQEETIPISPSSNQHKSNTPTNTLLLNGNQLNFIKQAVETKVPSTLAHSISLVPTIFNSVKSIAADDVRRNSKYLCKFKGGSVLLATKDIKAMTEFNIDSIWSEMLAYQPFLISVFAAVAGSKLDSNDIPEEVRVKFCFVYAILMNIKWDKLSLLQRINTVAMIEGGGSKKVILGKIFELIVRALVNKFRIKQACVEIYKNFVCVNISLRIHDF